MLNTTYKNIAHVKAALKIQPINTGKTTNFHGIVWNDVEALHAIKSISGDCLHLVSGVEMSMFEYRGQTQEYDVCLSSLDRIINDADLFLALCRSIYFQKVIAQHPWIQFLQNNAPVFDENILPLPICVNLEGIAQHYGLSTEYLDITNNFSVASFFATQKWNSQQKKFEPMRGNDNVGVLYKLIPVIVVSNPAYGDDIPYFPVGWQPFPRPEEQRANAIKLKSGQDFANSELPVTTYRFRHDYRQSKRIYAQFEGGNKLMPDDNLADFAESLKTKYIFPQAVIYQAANKTCQRKGITHTQEAQAQLMQMAGITAENEAALEKQRWQLSEAEQRERITALMSRVRYRRVAYAS